MSCACRAAPWRAFVQGLAQVHRLEAPPSSSSPLLPSVTRAACIATVARPRPALQSRTLHAATAPPQGQHRGFHASRGPRQDVAGAAAAKTHEPPNTTRATERLSAEPPSSQQEASSTPTEPQLRLRKRDGDAKADVDGSAARPADGAKPPTKAKRGRKPQPDSSSSSSHPFSPSGRNKKDENDEGSGNGDSSSTAGVSKPQRETWQTQKAALREKFPEGWRPRKRLSPDALAGIRALNAQFPDVYTTQALADKFEVSAEAIRRILKSKWQPSAEEEEERQQRWFRRGLQVWEHKAALGVKPPRKWRREGVVRDPAYHERRAKAIERERQREAEEDRRYREERRGRGGQQ
ncbi:Required for respiratory growth protein 9 mitochondrial [Purpureocillium takamizusanense]|uniref:Required for respiratory growth protein 9, mitochondrial n=1 Tax=Purpureocillium takamizusanense TaxID=2060973 RepID=A0A9Q8QI75_9HYPO|nr:Required for respiratory growth protein 9 mitochondrial [Purpureocillium takamizusanense]UNI20303.1 Required for respiratory growth protein 9 mitochondrial [Purpureocillium takamizusanense]